MISCCWLVLLANKVCFGRGLPGRLLGGILAGELSSEGTWAVGNDLRDRNRARIIHILMAESPTSRLDVARKLHLGKSTVSVIVAELLGQGLVSEVGNRPAASVGGRRPVLLQFNNQARLACGIEVDAETCHGVLVDLLCRPLRSVTRPVHCREVDDVVNTIVATVGELLAGFAPETCLGCGIAAAGMVDEALGLVRSSTQFAWRDVPLRDLLAARLDCPVYLTDRPKAALLGERWHGVGQGVDNMVYVHLGSGIGGGLVINGKLYTGASYGAGEIGHMTVDPKGPQCKCGNWGCLETMASGPAIARDTIARIKAGQSTILTEWVGNNLEVITAKLVDQAADQGDELALRVIHDTGEYVGIAIANVLNRINPQLVIVGGPIARFGDVFLDAIRQTVRRRAISHTAAAAHIVPTSLGEDAESIGAAALALMVNGGRELTTRELRP